MGVFISGLRDTTRGSALICVCHGSVASAAEVAQNAHDSPERLPYSQASYAGPVDWFTGRVRVDPLFAAPAPVAASGGLVTFKPGARTDLHAHPLGQILILTAGCGRV